MSFTIEKLQHLKDALTLLHGNKVFVPLKEELLNRLALNWRTRYVGFSNKVQTLDESISELVMYRYDSNACGCIGPQDGWPWCPCEQAHIYELYRMDIAMHILKTQTEVTTLEELIEMHKLVYPNAYQ